MPYVSTFVYCESSQINISPQGNTTIIFTNPMHIFTPVFVPGMFSFSVVFGILEMNTEQQHILRYTFSGPIEEEPPIIDTGEIIIPPQNGQLDLPKDMLGGMMNLDFRNVVFRHEGEYYSQIFLDGENLGRFPIKVKGREKTCF